MRTNLILLSTPLALGLLLASCTGGGEHNDAVATAHAAMMKADSTAKADLAAREAMVKAIYDAINTGNMEAFGSMLTDNFVDHEQDPQVTTTGKQGGLDMIAMMRTAYPDVKMEPLSMSTTDELTYIHFRMTGTNTGPWGSMPATGKPVDVMGVDVIRFENGKAAEHWGYMEEMKMMTQMGLMPAQGAPPAKKK